MTRLAVIFPGATSPPRDGASAFVRAVLALLAREGHEIELVVPSLLDPVEPPERTYGVPARWIRVAAPAGGAAARVRRAVSAVLRSRPAWLGTYASPPVVEEVRSAAERADLVVGFGASASGILAEVRAPSLLLLFSLPLADAERTGGSRLERRLARRFQERLPRRHGLVALTTPAEQEQLSAASRAATAYLPFPRTRGGAVPGPGSRPRLLFIADWNYPPNRAGLDFLLDEVMPEVWSRHAEVELVLAGKGSDALEVRAAGPVRAWGQYGELAEVADDATIAILPLLAAGGVRTRLLELLEAGLPVIATLAAAGGTDAGPGVVATQPEGFAACLLELLDSPQRTEELRGAARGGAGAWPSDAEVAERWAAAFAAAAERDYGRRNEARR